MITDMRNYLGFIFTDGPISDLQKKGFYFHENIQTLSKGYRSYTAVFEDLNGFEIREILDEQLYRNFHSIEHFKPEFSEKSQSLSALEQPNSIIGIREAIDSSKLQDCELKTFLSIRKPFPLWALWLKCSDFELFCKKAHPDRLFHLQNQKVALIHMGPNCFDLLISPESA